MTTRIYLAGRMAIEASDGRVLGEGLFRGRQGRMLFAYLVMHRRRPVMRSDLADLLWDEDLPPAWEGGLSAHLSKLESLVAPAGIRIERCYGQVQALGPEDTWVDLEAAETAIDRAEHALREGRWRDAMPGCCVARAISGRLFLADLETPWIAQQRLRLERIHLRALDGLGRVWLASGEYQLAVEAAVQALAIDPMREPGYRILMEAHLALGHRANAIKAYHDLRTMLSEHLGLDPAPDTERLYLEILG